MNIHAGTHTAYLSLDAMRADGWMVAVHNDYRLGGVPHTFYLLTHPSGVWAKGEGTSDEIAIAEAAKQASERIAEVQAAQLGTGKLVAVLQQLLTSADADGSGPDEGIADSLAGKAVMETMDWVNKNISMPEDMRAALIPSNRNSWLGSLFGYGMRRCLHVVTDQLLREAAKVAPTVRAAK